MDVQAMDVQERLLGFGRVEAAPGEAVWVETPPLAVIAHLRRIYVHVRDGLGGEILDIDAGRHRLSQAEGERVLSLGGLLTPIHMQPGDVVRMYFRNADDRPVTVDAAALLVVAVAAACEEAP